MLYTINTTSPLRVRIFIRMIVYAWLSGCAFLIIGCARYQYLTHKLLSSKGTSLVTEVAFQYEFEKGLGKPFQPSSFNRTIMRHGFQLNNDRLLCFDERKVQILILARNRNGLSVCVVTSELLSGLFYPVIRIGDEVIP